jgi:hypothetical protein
MLEGYGNWFNDAKPLRSPKFWTFPDINEKFYSKRKDNYLRRRPRKHWCAAVGVLVLYSDWSFGIAVNKGLESVKSIKNGLRKRGIFDTNFFHILTANISGPARLGSLKTYYITRTFHYNLLPWYGPCISLNMGPLLAKLWWMPCCNFKLARES